MMRAPAGGASPRPPRLDGSVAQLVEQYPFKVLVLGSSPSRPIDFIQVFRPPKHTRHGRSISPGWQRRRRAAVSAVS
jgi:hypothetical protein